MIGYTGRLRPKGVYFYDRGIKRGIGTFFRYFEVSISEEIILVF